MVSNNRLQNTRQSTLPFQRIVIPSGVQKSEQLIVDFIIGAMCPLSTVQNVAFKKMIIGNVGYLVFASRLEISVLMIWLMVFKGWTTMQKFQAQSASEILYKIVSPKEF